MSRPNKLSAASQGEQPATARYFWLDMDALMDGTFKTATLVITPEMLGVIAELDEFKGAWRALGTLAPERLSALRRVAFIESIGASTRIEGSTLSNREVEKFLYEAEMRSLTTHDQQEVAGYASIMETIFTSWLVLPLTENHVRQLHRTLLRHSTKDECRPGECNKMENHVEVFDTNGNSAAIVLQTASPFDTPPLMTELVEWTTEALSDRALHPLLVIAVFVVIFLDIQLFRDGNGHLSRALTTLLLLRAGYAYVPYSSIESVLEQSKEAYVLALRGTQQTTRSPTPDWEPWVMFFLCALQQQKRRLESRVERERKILGQLPELSLRIYELTKERGQVKVQDIVRATDAARGTVKDHLNRLLRDGYLTQHGKGKGTWYSLP
jgi:Fic family protein